MIPRSKGHAGHSSWSRLCEAVKEAAALAEDDTVSRERLAAVKEKLRLALNSLEKKKPETPVPEMPGKGSIHTAGKLKYKITSTSEKGGTVAVTAGTKKSMTAVKIPGEITIKGYRFRVTEIAAGAFKNYKKLTSVTIGSQVTKIGKSAFGGDTKLKTLIIQSKKIKSAGTRAFKNTGKKMTVRVPAGRRTAYRKMLKKSGVSGNAAVRIR